MESTRKTISFEGWSWFSFNNLRLLLGKAMKLYNSMEKGLKLKFTK